MLLIPLLACAPGPATAGPGGVAFTVAPADLGDPRADNAGFNPADGEGIGLALAFVLPAFGESAPVWSTPSEVWALLQLETVRDPGVCPFDRVDGGTTIHEGNCRSSDGYEFTGDVSERRWTEDGVERFRLEADVEVRGDTASALFDRVRLVGAIEEATPEEGSVDVHYDVNLELLVEGYWEARDPGDPRLAAWSSWIVSGSLEQIGALWRADLAADIAGAGGLTMVSEALTESDCPIEHDGTVRLGAGAEAAFEGVDACDACARVTDDAGTETQACAPDG